MKVNVNIPPRNDIFVGKKLPLTWRSNQCQVSSSAKCDISAIKIPKIILDKRPEIVISYRLQVFAREKRRFLPPITHVPTARSRSFLSSIISRSHKIPNEITHTNPDKTTFLQYQTPHPGRCAWGANSKLKVSFESFNQLPPFLQPTRAPNFSHISRLFFQSLSSYCLVPPRLS